MISESLFKNIGALNSFLVISKRVKDFCSPIGKRSLAFGKPAQRKV